jgi:hypothetical protein
MALSFDQYRYFSAAWLRNNPQYAKVANQSQATKAKAEPQTPAVRAASIARLVALPRVKDSNKPD